MQFRHILLALGVIALVAGIGLSIVSLRAPRQTPGEARQAVPQQSVMVAARDLPVATLLRSDDLKLVQMPADRVPPGAIQQGTQPGSTVLGAATEHAFKTGEAITEDSIIRSTDARFLRAVLAPGFRALSVSFSEPQIGAGLIQPGDHVDVLLTQNLTEDNAAYKSVGETIMSNLRVIAADRIHLQQPAETAQHVQAPVNQPIPRTVTLEVTPQQAEGLMVAERLGTLQLTLRGLVDKGDVASAPPTPPTWASEVSPALRYLHGVQGPDTVTAGAATASPGTGAAAPAAGPVAIDIFRGTKAEQRCYSDGNSVPCKPGMSAPASTGAPPASGAPASGAAAPAKASALPRTAAAHRA